MSIRDSSGNVFSDLGFEEFDTTQAVRIKTVVTQDGVLKLHGPFRAGDNVEVIVLITGSRPPDGKRYPLQGTPNRFTDPFGSVAEDDWAALQ